MRSGFPLTHILQSEQGSRLALAPADDPAPLGLVVVAQPAAGAARPGTYSAAPAAERPGSGRPGREPLLIVTPGCPPGHSAAMQRRVARGPPAPAPGRRTRRRVPRHRPAPNPGWPSARPDSSASRTTRLQTPRQPAAQRGVVGYRLPPASSRRGVTRQSAAPQSPLPQRCVWIPSTGDVAAGALARHVDSSLCHNVEVPGARGLDQVRVFDHQPVEPVRSDLRDLDPARPRVPGSASCFSRHAPQRLVDVQLVALRRSA